MFARRKPNMQGNPRGSPLRTDLYSPQSARASYARWVGIKVHYRGVLMKKSTGRQSIHSSSSRSAGFAATLAILAGAALASIAQAQPSVLAGRYNGTWTNTTFGSTGAIRMELYVRPVSGSRQFVVRIDADGNVFGGGDPGGSTINLNQVNATTWSGTLNGDPKYGNVTMSITNTGNVTVSGTSVPGGIISSYTATGTLTAAGALNLTGSAVRTVGGTANTTISLALGIQTPIIGALESTGLFGNSVFGISDLDADGRADILVCAPSEAGGNSNSVATAGRAYAISTATGLPIYTITDPNPEIGGAFGSSVSSVIDTNGDGVNDFVIGATLQSPGGDPANTGRAYLFNGRTGQLMAVLAPNLPVTGMQFGWSVAGGADMNGDGRGDIVVGAPFYTERDANGNSIAPPESGGAWVFRGEERSGGAATVLYRLMPSDRAAFDFYGYSTIVLRDITGDSRADFAVAAPQSLEGNFTGRSGKVYFYNGATGALIRTITTPSNQGDALFGASMFFVPDLNSDGRNEIIIGAPRESITVSGSTIARAGRAYVFNGSTGALIHTLVSQTPFQDGAFGFAVTSGPNLTDNASFGYAVGAPGEVNNRGRIHIYSASTGLWFRQWTSLFPQIGGRYGTSLSRIPDTNFNGRWDLIVGAPSEQMPIPQAPASSGATYVIRN